MTNRKKLIENPTKVVNKVRFKRNHPPKKVIDQQQIAKNLKAIYLASHQSQYYGWVRHSLYITYVGTIDVEDL